MTDDNVILCIAFCVMSFFLGHFVGWTERNEEAEREARRPR